ncbi:Cathepsin D [Durusdinium trenchii]|uniref:Cathepsin D n=1 Tax=Durusdinium trenchii TaxID=1381693 RepID=A0ABP0RB55_9DINO
MPNLAFEVQGTAGGQESLKLDPNSYVFLTTVPIVHKEVEYFLGYLPVEIVTVRQQQVCIPAFSPMNYRTKQNGPVWIMGTPLFYSYKVQYDREPEPPTMSFSTEGCGTCHDGVESSPHCQGKRGFCNNPRASDACES